MAHLKTRSRLHLSTHRYDFKSSTKVESQNLQLSIFLKNRIIQNRTRDYVCVNRPLTGSDCGTFDRAVASEARDPPVRIPSLAFFIYYQLLLTRRK